MQVESDVVRTTQEVNESYKSLVPKFEEKIDVGDTEYLVALCHRCKPFVVNFSHTLINLDFIVLCLYYASTMTERKHVIVLCHLRNAVIDVCTMPKNVLHFVLCINFCTQTLNCTMLD